MRTAGENGEITAEKLVEAAGVEPVRAQRENPTLSRTCNDHAALRMSGVSTGPVSSSPISFRVAATWQRPDHSVGAAIT